MDACSKAGIKSKKTHLLREGRNHGMITTVALREGGNHRMITTVALREGGNHGMITTVTVRVGRNHGMITTVAKLKKKCKKIRKRNDNENLQREILAENKLLKNLIKKKKSEYKLKIINGMKMNKKDQKNFWRLLEKLKEPRDNLFIYYLFIYLFTCPGRGGASTLREY